MSERQSIGADLAKGAIAGAVATWVMTKVTTAMYEREDKNARAREDEVRGGQTAYGVAAEKTARLAHVSLSDDTQQRAGTAIHWALGIGAGATYSVLRRRFDGSRKFAGLGFGTAFWLLLDEVAVPVLHLSPGPAAFPWQTHARGLAGHLSFGVVVDTTLRVLDA